MGSLVPEQATALKQKGNDAIKDKNFKSAVDLYTKAIALTPEGLDDTFLSILYSNRAHAYISQEDWARAVADGVKGMAFNDGNVKAIWTVAFCQIKMGEFELATKIAIAGSRLHPDDKNLKSLFDEIERAPKNENVDDIAHEGAAYKCVKLPGKGMGMVATRDIKYGELLLEERPLIEFSSDEMQYTNLKQTYSILEAKFKKLPTEVQRKALSLHSTNMGKKEIVGVVAANAFGGEDPHGAVLCFEASFFNHSCRPNVHHRWSKPFQRMYACRDIKRGEELCTGYEDEMLPKSERQEQLSRYGFECACEVCSLPDKLLRVSDTRRARYFHLSDEIASGMHPPTSCLKMVDEKCKILVELFGALPPHLFRPVAYDGTLLSIYNEDIDSAKQWAKKLYDAICIDSGEDSEDSLEVLPWVEDPTKHPEWETSKDEAELLREKEKMVIRT